MVPTQRTFLQGLSELERSALLAHAETSTGRVGSSHGSEASHGGRSELEQARQLLSKERERRQQLEAQVASLQATLREHTTQLDDLRNDRDAMRQQQLRHDDRGTRLASQLGALEQENASLSAKLLAAHNDRNQLQSKLDSMQVRMLELQQSYVSMASLDDGVGSRDLLRRSKIGGLLRDAAAVGVIDVDTATVERASQNKLAGSTIAALTRERDALQQRLHELSSKLADSVSREASARGAQALRTATWKRSAVQAEARLAAALKRVKELTEEVRKRDGELRQREKYTAQLERTVMAQHKSLQQQRRLLEMGGAGQGSTAQPTGSREAVATGPRLAAIDPESLASAQASELGGGPGSSTGVELTLHNPVRSPDGAAAGPRPGIGASLVSPRGCPIRAAWMPGGTLVRFPEPLDHGPDTAAGSPLSKADLVVGQHQQQQPALLPHLAGNPLLAQELGGHEHGLGDRNLRAAAAVTGSGAWTSQLPTGSGQRGGVPSSRGSADGSAAGRIGVVTALPAHLREFEAPGSSHGGASDEAPCSPLGGVGRSSSPPPAVLHQQLTSMEASLAQLYRELEEFKDQSTLECCVHPDVDADVGADVDSGLADAAPCTSPSLGHRSAARSRASHDGNPGIFETDHPDGDVSDEEWRRREDETASQQEQEQSPGRGSFAFLSSQEPRPPWSPPGSPGSLERRARSRDPLQYGSAPEAAARSTGCRGSGSAAPSSPGGSRRSADGSLRDGAGAVSPDPRRARLAQVRSGSAAGSGDHADDSASLRAGRSPGRLSSRGHYGSESGQLPRREGAARVVPGGAAALLRPASAAARSASSGPPSSSSPSVAGTEAGSRPAPSVCGSSRSEGRQQSQRPPSNLQQSERLSQEAAEGPRQPSAPAAAPPLPPARSDDEEVWRQRDPITARPASASTASHPAPSLRSDGSGRRCNCGGGRDGGSQAACTCGRCSGDGDAASSRGDTGGSVQGARRPTASVRPGPRMAVAGAAAEPPQQQPGLRRVLAGQTAAHAAADCDDGGDEQPRQPLPTHMLGHLLRCAAHHGHNHHQPRISPRGGKAVRGSWPSGAARGYAGGGAAGARARVQKPAAAGPGQAAPSAAAVAHGIVVARAATDTAAGSSAEDVSSEPSGGRGRGAPTGPAANGRRGRVWPIGGVVGRGRSPAGGSASTTPRGSSRGYATTGASTPRAASNMGTDRQGSFPVTAASCEGAMDGAVAPSYSMAPRGQPLDCRPLSRGAPRSRNSPAHSPSASPRRPTSIASPGIHDAAHPELPSSPEALSPISTLLANLSAQSPSRRAPRASTTAPAAAASPPHQQPQRPLSRDSQRQPHHHQPYPRYDEITSFPNQDGHGQRARGVGGMGPGTYPASGSVPPRTLIAPESSTSSSHTGGLAGAKRRPYDDDADGAEDRRKTRGSSGGGGAGGSGVASSSGEGSASGSNDGTASNTVGSSAGGRSSGCGSAAGPRHRGHNSHVKERPTSYSDGAAGDGGAGQGQGYDAAAADLGGGGARWRPPDPRISASQIVYDPSANPGSPSPRTRINPLPMPTGPGRNSWTASGSVGTSISKGPYGRPTLAGWLGSSGSQEDGAESEMVSTAAATAVPPLQSEHAGQAKACSPAGGGLSGPRQGSDLAAGGRSSPVAAAAAAAATALQRLRDKRMQRMQHSHQHLQRRLSGSSATPAAFREAVNYGPEAPGHEQVHGEVQVHGHDDGGLMVLALRGSLQGEVIVSPRLVPSASGSPGRAPVGAPEFRSQAFFPKSGAGGAGGAADGQGEVTVRLEVGGGANTWRPTTAAGSTTGKTPSVTGSAVSLGAEQRSAAPSLRALRAEMHTGPTTSGGVRAAGPQSGGAPVAATPALSSGHGQAWQAHGPSATASSSFGFDRGWAGACLDAEGRGLVGGRLDTAIGVRFGSPGSGGVGKGTNGRAAAPAAEGSAAAPVTATAPQSQPQSHPLMQLLGQASADLQLLNDRLKPLVGSRPVSAGRPQ